MIAYKLIKTYPGSPDLKTVHFYENFYSHQNWKGTEFYDAHSDFWEKVQELDYEILSVIGQDKRILSKANYTYPECFQTLVNATDTFKIFSVKRLSDGEVFTVGDEATIELYKKRYKIIKIRKFANNIQIHGEIEEKLFSYNLKNVIKLQPITPLFTTEDGVAIFVGDSYVCVTNQFELYDNKKQISIRDIPVKSFSTKDKAEEYVLLNKPCLSIIEVAPIFGKMHLDNSHDVLTRNLEKLKSLVQAKL